MKFGHLKYFPSEMEIDYLRISDVTALNESELPQESDEGYVPGWY